MIEPTPGLLPSPRRQSPGGDVRAVASVSRFGTPYGPSLPLGSLDPGERRGTFTGQSCQPLCEGETTKHLRSAHRVTVSPDEQACPLQTQRFMNVRTLAPILRPKRGSSFTSPSWSLSPLVTLRRRHLPRQRRVRDGLSERVRTRPGRIWIPINFPVHQNPHRLND